MSELQSKRSRRKKPEHEHSDDVARKFRERAADAVARATVHTQRLTALAQRRSGVTPDLVSGVGDRIYGMAIHQLDLAVAVLEGTQRVTDRLLDALDRCEREPLLALEAKQGEPQRCVLVIENTTLSKGKVLARATGPCEVKVRNEGPLEPKDQTTALLSFQTKTPGNFAGRVTFKIRGVRVKEVDFELWVHEK